MFGKNWKTSLGGLGMVLTGLADIVRGLTSDVSAIHWEADIVAITGGLGLLFAKDGNVTGGSVVQPTPVETLVQKAVEKADAGVGDVDLVDIIKKAVNNGQ